jgi:proline iminopeptidase
VTSSTGPGTAAVPPSTQDPKRLAGTRPRPLAALPAAVALVTARRDDVPAQPALAAAEPQRKEKVVTGLRSDVGVRPVAEAHRGGPGRVRLVGLAGAVLLGAVVLGVGAVLLVAVTGSVGIALAAGGLVELVVAATGLHLVLRRSPGGRAVAVGVAAGLAAVSAFAVLVPLPDPRVPPAPLPGEARWQLSTGSDIRYVRLPARGPVRPSPVVFLHGGPGIADLAGDAEYFGRLTGDGFNVYVYDQLGAGGSSRLSDPTGYGVGRDVADLEAIRRRIGADRMVLVGHSYGGTLAEHYLAAHPDRVAKLVLISPGPLDPADTSDARVATRLTGRERLRLYAALARPRALLGYGLLQVGPGAGGPRPAVRGSGFYRLQYPQSATAPRRVDPRPRLRGLPTPTLVLKGSCDYLSWRSAAGVRDVLPRSTLVYLPGAGHNAYQDRPDDVLAGIRAFLTGRPGPVPPYPGTAMPGDYEGPP